MKLIKPKSMRGVSLRPHQSILRQFYERKMFFSEQIPPAHTIASFLPSARNVIFDIKLLDTNLDLVTQHLSARGMDRAAPLLEQVADLNSVRRRLIATRDKARSERKMISSEIGQMLKRGEDSARYEVRELKKHVEDISAEAKRLDDAVQATELELKRLFLSFPNLLDDWYNTYLPIIYVFL